MAQEAHAAGARPTGATGAPHPLIERAMRILRHEQRTGHTDSAVKPGGLESFVARWVEDVRSARSRGELGERPFEETVRQQIAGYAGLDPMQRAAHVRSALAALESVGGMSARPGGAPTPQQRPAAATPNACAQATRLRREDSSTDSACARGAVAACRAAAGAACSAITATSPARGTADAATRGRVSAQGAGHRHSWRRRDAGRAAGQAGHRDGARPALHLPARAPRLQQAPEDYATCPSTRSAPSLGLIWEVETKRTSGGRTRTVARISDETGAIRVSWFNQPYLQKQLPRGSYIVVTGVKQRFGNAVEFSVRATSCRSRATSSTPGGSCRSTR